MPIKAQKPEIMNVFIHLDTPITPKLKGQPFLD